MAYYLGVSPGQQQQAGSGAFIPNLQSPMGSGYGQLAGPSVPTAPFAASMRPQNYTQTMGDMNDKVYGNIAAFTPGGASLQGLNRPAFEQNALRNYNIYEGSYGKGSTPWALQDPSAGGAGLDPSKVNLFGNVGQNPSTVLEQNLDYLGNARFGTQDIYHNAYTGQEETRGQGSYNYDPASDIRNGAPAPYSTVMGYDNYVNPYYKNALSDQAVQGYLDKVSQFKGAGQYGHVNPLPSADQYRKDLAMAVMPSMGRYVGNDPAHPFAIGNYEDTMGWWDWWGSASPYLGTDQMDAYQRQAMLRAGGTGPTQTRESYSTGAYL